MNVVYNASAGTGKTYKVTELYEKLVLQDGIEPCRILLMTFTDNAAAELRMRVSHRLMHARRTAEATGEGELAERIIRAMSQLPAAPIETIHAYCTRLLREHAIEAGLSPGFSTLVGDDRNELLEQICRDELLSRLETDPDFRTFCSGAQIISFGKGFGTSITETVPKLIGEAGSLGISLDNVEAMLPDPVPTASRIDFENICKRIRELPRITPSVKTALDILEQSLRETTEVELLVKKLGELGLKKFGRGEVNAISHDLWDLKTSAEDAVIYRERFPAAKAFARYVQSVYRRFEQRKHTMDVVDFDDQLHQAARLLKEGRAAPEFEYVLVDEVQDTSRIQCDIIRHLRNKDTRLVICGDRKQSIYTWRGADPQVMPDLEQDILDAGGRLENLQTSYRSAKPILDVVNQLFETVYGADEYSDDQRLLPNPAFETDDEKPCIEFLEDDQEDDRTKPEKTAAEMEAVASRIRLLISGDPAWRPRYRFHDGRFLPTGENNAYRYSDILILLRRTTHQSVLEQALRHANIPYTLGGKGRGLFTRQESRDVSLFLNVITNPADLYSLIGFLRSPWVGLSDETIAELAWSEQGFSAENLAAHFSTTHACATRETGFPACPPAELIQRYRALPATKLASELVRMLIDETGYDALLAGLSRGKQRLANLRKVLDWLRENERGVHTTPAGVARKLAKQIANPPQIPEAALLDPAQDAVTIMTVHGAKGLTKRVVVIPDISFSPDSDKGFARLFLDNERGPTVGIKVTAADKTGVESPAFKEARKRARTVRDHELKNLFYVAMTRARNLVVTSATVGSRTNGWYKEMQPLIGNSIPAIPYSELKQAVDIPTIPSTHTPSIGRLSAILGQLAPPPAQPKLQRVTTTRLAKETDRLESDIEPSSGMAADKAAALGSLGHAVLEQLALNGWEGSVAEWLERLRHDFGSSKAVAASLNARIEATRELMRQQTQNAREIRPEYPFVLHDGDRLIDGTIDLLVQGDNGIGIFDYKFTEASDDAVIDTYRAQMEIYCMAARRACPDTGEPGVALVVISPNGPRLLPVSI